MSLRHVLLGLLQKPRSGYDVKKQFDTSLRNFWKAELSQIYPALQKLEKDGLLSSEKLDSERGPQRVVYARTDAGRDELIRWLEDGPTVGTERIGFLAQTYFLSELDDPYQALGFIRELRAYFSERLAYLEQVETTWSAANPLYPDELPDADFFPQLTLDCGIHRLSATVDWCDKTIARLEKRQAG